MNSPTIYVMRHGLATHSKVGYGAQILTAELLPEGIPKVKATARWLAGIKFEAAFVSPIKRCQQTAAYVAEETGLKFLTDDRLREMYDETELDVIQRVSEWWHEQINSDVQTIFACSHGAVLGVLKHLSLDGSAQAADVLDYPDPAGLLKLTVGSAEELTVV